MIRALLTATVAFSYFIATVPGYASDPSSCTSIASDIARLACYDGAVGFNAPGGQPSQNWNGSGIRTTNPFQMVGPWRLSWKTDGYTSFTINPMGSGQMPMLASSGDNGGNGSTYIANGGTFTISINTTGDSWHAWATPLGYTSAPSDAASNISTNPPSIPTDIEPTETTDNLPDCTDDVSKTELQSAIENSGLAKLGTLKVISIDNISSVKTQSGRDLCIARAFTSQGEMTFDFQWISHSGEMYLFEKPDLSN